MMGYWNQRVIMEKIGLNPRDTIQDFESFYSYVYGSPFSIAWYARNKAWMEPELIEVTDGLILDRPSQSMPEFVEDMNNRMCGALNNEQSTWSQFQRVYVRFWP